MAGYGLGGLKDGQKLCKIIANSLQTVAKKQQ
jgi:hypothetical protein